MENKNYHVDIHASRERVWQVLWEDAYYREWTSHFTEGSHAVGEWKKGGKILFLDPNQQGMVSIIEELIPAEYMSFKHIGGVKDGVEDYTSPEIKKYVDAGARERYTLKEVDGKTSLDIDVDVDESYQEHFENTWPKALKALKELAEGDR